MKTLVGTPDPPEPERPDGLWVVFDEASPQENPTIYLGPDSVTFGIAVAVGVLLNSSNSPTNWTV